MVVKAFKSVQRDVKPTNWKVKNKHDMTWNADAPILYPQIKD